MSSTLCCNKNCDKPLEIYKMCNDKNVRVNNTSADEFYEQLSNAIDEVPAHNLLAVIGDWNAKI